ncbi:hypothetical protein M758_UG212200 [Ceratodon purpureus]|nr:hypothetical protein M758_UG212200 [Ceratodon purpureus]
MAALNLQCCVSKLQQKQRFNVVIARLKYLFPCFRSLCFFLCYNFTVDKDDEQIDDGPYPSSTPGYQLPRFVILLPGCIPVNKKYPINPKAYIRYHI